MQKTKKEPENLDTKSYAEHYLKLLDRCEAVLYTIGKPPQSSFADEERGRTGANNSLSERLSRGRAAEIGKEWHLLLLSHSVTQAETDRRMQKTKKVPENLDTKSYAEHYLELLDRCEAVLDTIGKSHQYSSAEEEQRGNGANNSLSERFLREVAAEIGKEWYLLSLSLGVTQAEIDRIEYDRGYDSETKIVKALLKWRSKSSHLSAHSQLEQLITELQENGRQDLADRYREYLEKALLTQVSVESESENEEDGKIRKLQELLFIFNEKETQRVPVSPLQKSATLSIDEIYAPVYIIEDLEYKEKGRNIGRTFRPQKKSKHVKGPDDIFYINKEKEEMVENVFMLGEAGHGKTVFCQQLLKKWCSAREKMKASKNVHQLDKWEEFFLEFDYLFHVQLRHVDERRTSLIDMICHDVFERYPGCHMTIRHVVSNGIQKCLVVVDGLDEWKLSKEEKSKLKFEGLPNLDGMGNSTIFWTLRPWKFDDIIETLRSRDRVLEIHGLEGKGIEVITDKVLANFYELDMDSMDHELLKNEILKKLADEQLKDLMTIPLIAIAGIQIWTEKKRVANSMTTFFIALTDMLIGRALKKKDISEKASSIDEKSSNERTGILKRFEESDYAVDYLPLLEKLGETAYNDLISNEKNLVFKKRYLERNLGKHTVEFALKVGLLSQCEAPGCFSEENISINFFHKSMQEFMAAIYVASGKVSGASFCSSLTDFQVIFELGNIVMFLSGLDPSIGTLISQHIARLADSDKEVTEYRQDWISGDDKKIMLLYKLQLSCFREIRFAQTILKSEEVAMVKPVITDVFVDKNSDKYIIHNTLDILVNYPSTIKSLTIDGVSNNQENGITDQVLSNSLDNAVSLQSLCVSGFGTYRCLHKVGDIFYSLKCLVLYNVKITWDVLLSLTTILSSNKILKGLAIWGIMITDNEKKKEEAQLAPLSGVIQTLPSLQQLTSLFIGVHSKEEKLLLIEVLRDLSCLEQFDYKGHPEHDSDDDVHDDDVHDDNVHDDDVHDDDVHDDDVHDDDVHDDDVHDDDVHDDDVHDDDVHDDDVHDDDVHDDDVHGDDVHDDDVHDDDVHDDDIHDDDVHDDDVHDDDVHDDDVHDDDVHDDDVHDDDVHDDDVHDDDVHDDDVHDDDIHGDDVHDDDVHDDDVHDDDVHDDDVHDDDVHDDDVHDDDVHDDDIHGDDVHDDDVHDDDVHDDDVHDDDVHDDDIHGDDVHDDDVHDDDDYDALIVCAAATQCAKLRKLSCSHIHMDRIPLSSNFSMSKIEEIYLYEIRMSKEGWQEFILSLMNVQCDMKVTLYDTDITVENQMMIEYLPQFEITKSEIDENGRTIFQFTKLTTFNV